ncbi:uncharacterized protein LOC133195693 [Saccostrea echinata]|uniref:uncharacterized protein LOC133195693 n=1 Tax=Saccostrea echinata TaxID=191078 RepID=UPI002A804118|nr:uncharacterized protein LOC133195693 [Saccostrea echinata]
MFRNMFSHIWTLLILVTSKTGDSTTVKDEFCGGIFEEERTGIIRVPSQSGTQYAPFLNCRWEITAKVDERITLVSNEWAVEESPGCTWDYLEIRDGSENISASIGKFCGYHPLRLITESNRVFLYFVSDGSFQDWGFQLSFKTVPKGSPTQCNSIITRDGYITSPGYPSTYPPNQICLYWVKFPDDKQCDIELVFLDVTDETCLFDRLDVYEGRTSHGKPLKTFCGKQKNTSLSSESNWMLLVFASDYYQEGRGFKLYTKSRDKNLPFLPILNDNSCDKTIETEINGTLSSPGYPEDYPNNAHCVTVIRAPIVNHVIRVSVNFLEMEASKNCSFDSLTIYATEHADSTIIGKLCGVSEQKHVFESASGSIRIEFRSDSVIHWRGYEATFDLLPKRVCYPPCPSGTVCVNKAGTQICTVGLKCSIDICYHGDCVQNNQEAFKCFCHQGYGGAFCRTKVDINKNSTGMTMLKSPKDHEVFRGNREILECKSNDPSAQYIWLYEGLLLQSDNEHITVLPGGILDIQDFSEELEGAYKCIANTATDFVEVEFRLTLKESCYLAVEAGPMDTVVEIGSTALLSCFVPAAKRITWYKDNTQLTSSHYLILAGGFYLKIDAVRPEDTGNYCCLAEGETGCTAQRYAKIMVDTEYKHEECGAPAASFAVPQMSARISSGSAVTTETTAWHVILRENIEDKTFCGGTLISNKWLITAAHCFAHYSNEFKRPLKRTNIDLILGTNKCNGEGGIKRRIKQFITYPDFAKKAIYDNDIALVEMDDPVNFTDKIQALCLKPKDMIEDIFLTQRVGRRVGRVIGCGQIYENIKETPEQIHDVYVPTINRKKCEDANIGNGNFTDSMFCAGYERALFGDACYGDSGGSLSMRLSDSHPWVLVGVVSWGVGCDRPKHYGYYTNVGKFYDWIQGLII